MGQGPGSRRCVGLSFEGAHNPPPPMALSPHRPCFKVTELVAGSPVFVDDFLACEGRLKRWQLSPGSMVGPFTRTLTVLAFGNQLLDTNNTHARSKRRTARTPDCLLQLGVGSLTLDVDPPNEMSHHTSTNVPVPTNLGSYSNAVHRSSSTLHRFR